MAEQKANIALDPALSDAPVIEVRGAREHNLKNVDVLLPRNKLVVLTGLSGSGKSSLAFDTIYAEGQRRYVESLSAYARQFLELMQKPDVDSIEGLSPAISIEQKTTSKNPRSTVGTVTEIYDYLRLLYARVGVPYSPATGLPIESQTISQMVDKVMEMPEGTRLYLLAPVVRGRKGEYRKELAELQKRGFQRVKIDGTLYEIDESPKLDKKRKHDIEVVVDRVVVRPGLESRLADSFETALALADGLAFTEEADGGARQTFSARFACPVSGFTIDEIEPRLFSFNNPFGACPSCDGLGQTTYVDPELVVPEPQRSLHEGAIAPWANSSSPYYAQTLDSLARHYGVSLHDAWQDLPKPARDAILYGTDGETVAMQYDDGLRSYQTDKPFEGVIPNLERRWRETDSDWVRDEIGKYQAAKPCAACDGHRLKPEALAVKIDGLHIGEVAAKSVAEAAAWFAGLEGRLRPQQQEIARRILKEINERLGFLNDVGLTYLTLARASATLSGGESQRIRLASQIGSGLTGVLYVLDEPSIGLHQRDNARLLETLRRLRDLGNTVIVVEHDEDAIRTADWVVDMGPRRRPARRAGGGGRRAGESRAVAGKPDRPVPDGPAPDPGPRQAPQGPQGPADQGDRCARAQSEGRQRRDSAGHAHLRHRRLGLRQIDPDHRDALQGPGPQAERRPRGAGAARFGRGPGVPGQDHRHRPVAHRPDAPVEPRDLYRRLHADPRLVRRPAGSQRPRLRARPLLLQRQGRALRGLPGRRRHKRSRCTSCPTSTSPATSARASATTARPWRSPSAASPSPTCWR